MELPFLNPWLLAALPAVGVPVLIHLLNRHKSVTIEWGAMELLRRVMVFRSRQIRLEDLVLMLLRCLAVLLVVLAVARPTTRWLPVGARPDTGVVLALDNSLSMSHRPGVASRFEDALVRVREILKTVEPGRPVTLVTVASRPRVAVRNAGYEPDRFEQVLKDLQPSDEPLNLESCLAEMEGLVAEIKAPRREVHFITDGQAITFGSLSDRAKEGLKSLSSAAQLFLVAVPCANEENVAVTELDLAAGVLRAGATARFQATVHNFGRTAQDAGEVSLLLDDQVVDKRFIGRLAPGQAVPVRLYAPLSRARVVRVTAKLDGDALPADDVRRAVAHVRSVVRVLCVDGDPVDRSDSRAASLVMTALAPKTIERAEALPSVERIPWTALPGARFSDYDVVVLVNVADVQEDKAVALRKYVEQGGGLVLMAGANVKPDVLNRRLLAAGSSLLPGELLSAAVDSGLQVSGAPLDLDVSDHPLVRPLQSLPKELLGEARFYRCMRVHPLPEGRTLLRLAGGDPVLMERAVGRGKVLLWTSGADLAWNNLPVNPAFPILWQQAVTYLARQPFETPVTVPDPIVLPLPGVTAGAEVDVTAPDGDRAVVPAALRAGEVVVETSATTVPGFYDIQTGPDDLPMTVAANVDTAESDVKILSAQELAAGFADWPVRVLPAEQGVAAAVGQARTGWELWQMLVVVAVVVLAGESLLARWYTRRGA